MHIISPISYIDKEQGLPHNVARYTLYVSA